MTCNSTLFSLANYLKSPVPENWSPIKHTRNSYGRRDMITALCSVPRIKQKRDRLQALARHFEIPVEAARYECMALDYSTLMRFDRSTCSSEKYVQPVTEIFNSFFVKRGAPKQKLMIESLSDTVDGSEMFSIYHDELSPLEHATLNRAYVVGYFLAPGTIQPEHQISQLESFLHEDSPVGAATRMAINRIANLDGAWGIVSDQRHTIVLNWIGDPADPDYQFKGIDFGSYSAEEMPLRYVVAVMMFTMMEKRGISAYNSIAGPPPPLYRGVLPQECPLPKNPKWRSDFDIYMMQRNLDHWEAFRVWRSRLMREASEQILRTTQTLKIRPHQFSRQYFAPSPYPKLVLPPETLHSVTSSPRPRDFVIDTLLNSNAILSFTITHVARAKANAWSQVVFGRLVDHGRPVCLKIFDERLFPCPLVESHIEAIPPWWRFTDAVVSEDLVRQEVAIYDRVKELQGTILPHFYGVHLITLPGGWQAYAIILEIIDGPTLDEIFDREQSEDTRMSMEHKRSIIMQAQHAVRALNYATITQIDWHTNQIMCPLDPQGNPQVVLIDFAMAHLFLGDEGGVYGREDHSRVNELLGDTFGEDIVDATWGPAHDWDFSR